jgi:hypothetical protein
MVGLMKKINTSSKKNKRAVYPLNHPPLPVWLPAAQSLQECFSGGNSSGDPLAGLLPLLKVAARCCTIWV